MNNYTIVMTACIAPNTDRPLVARVDAGERLADYQRAVRFWLSLDDPRCERVVFLENSGYPLDGIHEVALESDGRRPFEAVHVGDNQVPEGVSYGYAELGMLDAASVSVDSWSSAKLLVKVTGRLTFPNLTRLMSRVNPGVQFLADARNTHLPMARTAENGVLTTQLMAFTPSFYRKRLMSVREKMEPRKGHRLIESVIYRELFDLQRDKSQGVSFRFPVGCPPRGFAAHWQKEYGVGVDAVTDRLRGVARRTTPWWWV